MLTRYERQAPLDAAAARDAARLQRERHDVRAPRRARQLRERFLAVRPRRMDRRFAYELRAEPDECAERARGASSRSARRTSRRCSPRSKQRRAKDKIDVIAHCMGTVVFGMAVLGGPIVRTITGRRAAFTQVGPLVVFSPANIFRAYVLRYFLEFLPEGYSFKPRTPTLADDSLRSIARDAAVPRRGIRHREPDVKASANARRGRARATVWMRCMAATSTSRT